MEGFVRAAKKERVAVIYTGGDKAVEKDGGIVGGQGGAEAIDVSRVEVGRPGDVIDVGLKG